MSRALSPSSKSLAAIASLLWKKYYGWPDSYAKFIQYIWSRYQANNTVLSPIHLDINSVAVKGTGAFADVQGRLTFTDTTYSGTLH